MHKVSPFSHPCLQFLCAVFLIIVILIGVRCYLQREVAKLFGVLFKICKFSVLFFRNCHLYKRNSQLACMFTSIQFSHSVVFNSLQPHGWQHARPSCPSPTPRVYLNSCPSSRWCHPTISSSVIPFNCRQSFQASGSFQMSQFSSGGQSIGVSTSVHQ